jgi:hypothetical protein
MNDSRDEWLEAALRSGGDDAPERKDCPSAERIWRAVHLELPLDERLAIIDHLAECPACTEAWRIARAMTPPGAGSPAAQPAAAPAIWKEPRVRLLAAAAVLVLASIPLALYIMSRSLPPERGDGAIESGIATGAALPREDFRLRWSGGPEGARYDITVSDAALKEIVTERGLTRPEYRVTPERLAGLPSRTEVLWTVVARAPDGRTRASPTFKVVLQ